MGEIGLFGYIAIDDNNSSYTCTTQVVLNNTVAAKLSGAVTYQDSLTPMLQSISPRYGTVRGGTVVTFTGTNFVADPTQYSIIIDGVNCPVSSATTTQIQCTTGKRPGIIAEQTLTMTINNMGAVATMGLTYMYANLWSDTITWGGEFAPIEGDLVYIPAGLNLIVDVDSTPVLSAVVVDGSLIFPSHPDPTH